MARAAHRFLILQLAHVDGGSNKLLPVDVACTSGGVPFHSIFPSCAKGKHSDKRCSMALQDTCCAKFCSPSLF